MKNYIFVFLLFSVGCNQWHHLRDGSDTAVLTKTPIVPTRSQPSLLNTIVLDGTFQDRSYGSTFHFNGEPDADVMVMSHWMTHGGGDGTRPNYDITLTQQGVQFDVLNVPAGLSNGVRIYQRVQGWQQYAGKTIRTKVRIKTDIPGKIGYAVDAGGIGEHIYSSLHTGSGQWETIITDYYVPLDAQLLWLKIGPVTADVTVGQFTVGEATMEVL